MDYIVFNKMSVAKLVAVGYDDKNVNTGLRLINSFIRLLEEDCFETITVVGLPAKLE